MTIYANSAGETVTFQFDTCSVQAQCSTTTTFVSDGIVGNVVAPFEVVCTAQGGDQPQLSSTSPPPSASPSPPPSSSPSPPPQVASPPPVPPADLATLTALPRSSAELSSVFGGFGADLSIDDDLTNYCVSNEGVGNWL